MSQYLRKVIDAVEGFDPEAARAHLDQVARLQPRESMFHKGVDIAQAILKKLTDDSDSTEVVPPIFSTSGKDYGELTGFCDVFGVRDLSVVEESLCIMGKASVSLETVVSASELTDRERTFMLGRLPAVRVIFSPIAPEV